MDRSSESADESKSNPSPPPSIQEKKKKKKQTFAWYVFHSLEVIKSSWRVTRPSSITCCSCVRSGQRRLDTHTHVFCFWVRWHHGDARPINSTQCAHDGRWAEMSTDGRSARGGRRWHEKHARCVPA